MFWVYVASGFVSLVYQVVWQRMLTLHTGTSALAITLVVSAWMLGLGLGALAGGRIARVAARPRLAYAGVEAALGAVGFASPWLARAAGPWLDALSPVSSSAVLFAGLVVPTTLMGATLPILATIAVRSRMQFTSCVSHLYFANTMGAAAGALVTGYVLVAVFGLAGCTVVAASANMVLAAAMVVVEKVGGGTAERAAGVMPAADVGAATAGAEVGATPPPLSWAAVVTLAFASGFLAIGYEIVWYRVVGTLVKDSPYAFATVLAVYLAGIALGSLGLSRAARERPSLAASRTLFFGLQALTGVVALGIVAGFYHLAATGPLRTLVQLSFTSDAHPPASFTLADGWLAGLFPLFDVVLWPALFVLPPALVMGASVPLAASLAFGRGRCVGGVVGASYAASVAGNVAGGLVTGLVLFPALGTERILLAFGIAGVSFGVGVGRLNRTTIGWPARWAAVTIAIAAAAIVFPGKGQLYAAMHVPPFEPAVPRFTEGRDAVVATYEGQGLLRNFINGQGHGYRPGPLFLAEAAAGLAAGEAVPRRVLIVGLGAGSIADVALLSRATERIVIVELCESALRNLSSSAPIAAILGDPRVRVVIDDGRRYLQRNRERFDAILLDPVRTTTASSTNLHSREFFALARSRLAAGGVVMVGGIGDSRVIPRTLAAAFAHVRWHDGYCLASDAPLSERSPRLAPLLGALAPDVRAQVEILLQGGVEGGDLDLATRGVPVNEDWRPVCEYYLLR